MQALVPLVGLSHGAFARYARGFMVEKGAREETWWERTGTAVAADGTRLFFASAGPEDAPTTICCANGVGVSTFFWNYVGAHFKDRFRVIVWDYRGHGRSDPPKDPSTITMASVADDLALVLDANHVDKALLLGHSMGSQVILEFYRLYPARVLGLVPMLGAFGHPADTFINPAIGRLVFQAGYNFGIRFPEVLQRAAKISANTPLGWLFAKRTGLVHRDLCRKQDLDPYLEHLAELDFRVFMEMVRAAQDHDAGPILSRIDVPTLIVAGEKDLFTPMYLSLEMAQRVPSAELLQIPRGSHAALIEQPGLINRRLERFIAARFPKRDPAPSTKPEQPRIVPPVSFGPTDPLPGRACNPELN